MRPVRALPWAVLAVVVGLAAERVQYRFGDPALWLPDLLTGWTLVGCGLVAWCGRPNRRVGPLLTATGLLWFVGNFAAVPVEPMAWIAVHGVYLHRGPLVHSIVTYPAGEARSRLGRAATLGGYTAAAIEAAWADERSAIILGLALIVVTAVLHDRCVPRERRSRLLTLWVVAALGSVIAGGAAARLIMFPSDVADNVSLAGYQAVLCAAAFALTVGVLSRSMAHAEVADLVVELGEERSDRLRNVLAGELGDPTLQVGYWSSDTNGYVDAVGRPLSLPTVGGRRASTTIGTPSDPVGILIHHPSLLDDPGLLASIATAARLASVNALLQAEVRAQIAELEASRRRIVTAGDEAHRRLEQRLRNGAEHRLEDLADRLHQAEPRTGNETPSGPLGEVDFHLAETLADLRMLAAGLHPRVLTERGLGDALDALAARSHTDIVVTVNGGCLSTTLQGAVYFICSEALTNVDKHAAAASASVAVTVGDRVVRIVVSDNGVGGADPAAGSGLVNLVDRVHALGGTFDIASPRDGGTCVVVELPVDATPG